jgi:membrane protease YdiL (CAAX protease family)
MTTPQLFEPPANVPPVLPSLSPQPALGRPRSQPLREAVTFVGLVYAIVVGIALALPHAPGLTTPLLTMLTPAFVVLLIVVFGTGRGHRRTLLASLGLHHFGLRSWPAAFAIAVVMILVVPYSVTLALGSAAFTPFASSGSFWLAATSAVLENLALVTLLALGEEIGWRGYLLPRVQALVSKRRAALVVGFVHGVFHLPLILLTTTYDSVGSRWVVAPVVVVTLTLAGVLYAWLRDRSGSVWPVAFAHATVNTFVDGGDLIVVTAPVALAYTAGESGIMTLVAVLGTAIVLLLRGSTWRSAASPVRTTSQR